MVSPETREDPTSDSINSKNKLPNRREFLRTFGMATAGMLLVPPGPEDIAAKPQGKDVNLPIITKETIESPEDRVNLEIEKAKNLIESHRFDLFLTDPFLVSALYYSSNFAERLLQDQQRHSIQTNYSRQICAGILELITPEIRQGYLQMLKDEVDKSGMDLGRGVTPIEKFSFGIGENHPDALDLFTEEGSKVRAIQGGVVVLAENGWNPTDQFSTSSPQGGNQIIIFNPKQNAFYRYCHLEHLETVPVSVGEVIPAGQQLGSVGHTGLNASRSGHGKHLHLEINQVYSQYRTNQASAREIRQEILSTE
jgi:murein DD-endopeptidase MepM/ murein hydrolase activator NlpD